MASIGKTEVVCVFWPMTIPAYAKYSITSSYPLKVNCSEGVSFVITLGAPVHLSSPSPVNIEPSGVLSPGFARGWSALPTELKLAILRHNLIVSYTIWPRNANRVIRDVLLHHLRLTPEIANLARELYFAENVFMILPLEEQLSMFRGLPPISVRPLIHRLTLLTWLEPIESKTVEAIASRSLGFNCLTYVEVRCSVTKYVKSYLLEKGLGASHSIEDWSARLKFRLPPLVSFESDGVLTFDRLEFGKGCMDMKLVEIVEGLVKERFTFSARP